jgi:hypothetical protein
MFKSPEPSLWRGLKQSACIYRLFANDVTDFQTLRHPLIITAYDCMTLNYLLLINIRILLQT